MAERINETGASVLFVLDAMYSFIADAIAGTCIQTIIVLPASESLPRIKRIAAKALKKTDKAAKQMMQEVNCCAWRAWMNKGDQYTGLLEETYRKDNPVVMVYSSGTTGASKGIQLTNDGINATIAQYEYGFPEVVRQRSFLHIIPIWFSSGVSISLLMPLCLGVTCILEPVFDFKSFTRDVKKYKPSYAFATTSFWLDALEHIGSRHKLSHFLCPMTGGEPLLPSAEKTINEFLALHGYADCLQKGWGLCELGATAVASSGSPSKAGARNRIGSAGLPLPQVTVSVFDMDSNQELPYGHHGELRVLTPCRMLGYYHNPQATSEFFREGTDGKIWGCTGDVGYMDADGFVYICGRANDSFFTSSGARIYILFDIENVILQDSAVDICEVVDMQCNGDDGGRSAYCFTKRMQGRQERYHSAHRQDVPKQPATRCRTGFL
jgi:long-chain acyl-CoA synthetase